jgi:hypothetical protein
MRGFLAFTEAVERILMRQFANRLLWVVVGTGLFAVAYLNEIQRATMRWPTEHLLARLNFVVEVVLLASFAVILIWESYVRLRHPHPKTAQLPGARGYTLKFHLAAVLLLLVVAGLHLALLSYYQYVHILTVLQRGFLIWLTVILIPTVYLLVNPKSRGGLQGVAAFIVALLALIAAEWVVVTLSLVRPAWERLGDVYYWNQLFPRVAQERIWLTIYQPYLGWYFLGYLGANIALYLALVLRVLALGRRDAKREGGTR